MRCFVLKIKRQIFERIDNIKWFTNCGSPLTNENINRNIILVSNWEQAKIWYSDANWENTTLEARNTLTEFLHNKYPNNYLEWNSTVREVKGFIKSSLSAKLQAYSKQNNLDNVFVDCVIWDVLHAIMEYAYLDCKKLPLFFLDLLLVYENGNFPCGWEGEYPKNGNLVVY